jgi:hypothetical protein
MDSVFQVCTQTFYPIELVNVNGFLKIFESLDLLIFVEQGNWFCRPGQPKCKRVEVGAKSI